jgi:addiction module HigA family antidote
VSIAEAASRLGVTRAHLSRVLNGHAGITANMSLRLSAALGTSPDFWLKMQMHHDIWLEQRQPKKVNIRPFPHVAVGKAQTLGSPVNRSSRVLRPQSRTKETALSAAVRA